MQPRRATRGPWAVLTAWMVLALAGCGGSSNDSGDGGGDSGGEPTRGELLQTPPELVATLTQSDLFSGLDAAAVAALLDHTGTPVCDISIYRIRYATVGARDEATTSTGALMVPTGTASRCTGARPIVLYAHGTTTDDDYDITDVHDSENAEGLFLAAFFAAQGYLVVAPNYTGYGASTLPYHPYLVADAQAKDMIDSLAAARSALPVAASPNVSDDGRLYVSGYSQGGYVAMATQRAMQAAGQAVTASAPMSGPYALSAFADAVFLGRVNGGAPVFTSFLMTAFQDAYGNMYTNPIDAFQAQYADTIDTLLPSTRPRSEFYDAGDLPQHELFDSTPPAPEFADVTPATTPERLAPVFARGFGPEHLLLNSYRLAYLQDAQLHPDGFWPTPTNDESPADPAFAFRVDLKRNDLRDWAPTAPTLLCGGQEDPTVYWLNTEAMQAYWSTHAPSVPVTYLDVDAAGGGSSDPYDDLKHRFGIAKDLVATAAVLGGASDGGFEAVMEQYHAGLVAPFCMEATQKWFASH